jgi:hypothetical protein
VRAITASVAPDAAFELSIDQAGKRPTVVIRLSAALWDAEVTKGRLAQALSGFEFATTILLSATANRADPAASDTKGG